MSCAYLFGDEAGNFRLDDNPAASRYFILCTVRMDNCELGADLLDLRRRMLLRGIALDDQFHATGDRWSIRNEVYNLISQYDFRVDATILEKRKAQPVTRPDDHTFYKYAWYYHAKHVISHRVNRGHDLLITAAALGKNKTKAAFKNAFNNVVQQVIGTRAWAIDFRESANDPCLQAADYCAWAIQRKWEFNDQTSYALIARKVVTEYDLWAVGRVHYY